MNRIKTTQDEALGLFVGLIIFCIALGFKTEVSTGWMALGAGIIILSIIFE
jgi:hypothetical protein